MPCALVGDSLGPAASTTISENYFLEAELTEIGAHLEKPFGLIVSGHRKLMSDQASEACRLPPADLGPSLDVVFVRDILENLVVDLDFPAQQITFQSPGFVPPGRGMTRVELIRGSRGERCIPISFGGPAPILAGLDLGGSSALMMSNRYIERAGISEGRKRSTSIVNGVSGVTQTNLFSAARLIVGGITFHDVPTQGIGGWCSDDVLATIGLPLIEKFRVILDFPSGAVWLPTCGAPLGKPFRKDHSGLCLVILDDRLRVVHVGKGSPAESQGLKVGDEISHINGLPVDLDYAASGLWRWRGRDAGEIVDLTLCGGGRRGIELAEYF